jgi:integrase/recombinase XerC
MPKSRPPYPAEYRRRIIELARAGRSVNELALGQIVPVNPASVRGPKHIVRKGKTPVLEPAEARTLLDRIDVTTPGGLRDRARIGLMVYSFARSAPPSA